MSGVDQLAQWSDEVARDVLAQEHQTAEAGGSMAIEHQPAVQTITASKVIRRRFDIPAPATLDTSISGGKVTRLLFPLE